MKRSISLFSFLFCLTSFAQNTTEKAESGPAYIGEERIAIKFDGSIAASMDCSELGITVGAYDNNPNQITTSLVVMISSSGTWKEINSNMKLILKVAGNPMTFSTQEGTDWVGSHNSYVGSAGVLGALGGVTQTVYTSKAYYPITESQLDSLMQYGFTKYRFQIVGDVTEGEFSDRKTAKLGKKIKEAYEYVREKQAKNSAKMNDLSDF
ncbi:MAG: hypothetical protein MJZ13_07490 [Bacteroidales bacterium]|nr:hypothetical protein [Bacteroidales bacterium]